MVVLLRKQAAGKPRAGNQWRESGLVFTTELRSSTIVSNACTTQGYRGCEPGCTSAADDGLRPLRFGRAAIPTWSKTANAGLPKVL
jgi:hypothetical protein